jgi:hypothetical protein
LYLDGKNRAMLRSFRLVRGLLPDAASCSSLHSISNTNALYCRAVSSNNLDINVIKNLTYRLALTQLAYGNSRFCFLKFTKPDHEHHLQASPLPQA